MEDAMCHFHTVKDVVLLERTGPMMNAKANAVKTELV